MHIYIKRVAIWLNFSARKDYIQQSDILKHKFIEKGYNHSKIMEAFSKYIETYNNGEDPPVAGNNAVDPLGPLFITQYNTSFSKI